MSPIADSVNAADALDADKVGAFHIVREEELSARSFLDLIKREPSAIKHVKIVAPVVGERRASKFGRVIVEYATPRLRKR